MSQPAAAIAATLSSVLTLLRAQPPRREDQARAFKAFLTALGDAPLDLRVTDMGVELSGLPVTTDLPGAGDLADHLRGHGVASIRLPGGLAPASLLSVLRALSSPVGRFDSVEHLLADIDYWRDAPLWEPESIAKATEAWFEALTVSKASS